MNPVTISREEFLKFSVKTFCALVKTGKLTPEDKVKFADISAAFTFMFTDNFENVREELCDDQIDVETHSQDPDGAGGN